MPGPFARTATILLIFIRSPAFIISRRIAAAPVTPCVEMPQCRILTAEGLWPYRTFGAEVQVLCSDVFHEIAPLYFMLTYGTANTICGANSWGEVIFCDVMR